MGTDWEGLVWFRLHELSQKTLPRWNWSRQLPSGIRHWTWCTWCHVEVTQVCCLPINMCNIWVTSSTCPPTRQWWKHLGMYSHCFWMMRVCWGQCLMPPGSGLTRGGSEPKSREARQLFRRRCGLQALACEPESGKVRHRFLFRFGKVPVTSLW